MSNFKDYADYYDLFYKDKEYGKEVEYVKALLEKHSKIKVKDILDIGCGTGKHDILLSKHGYFVTGIDISEEMITIAKKNNNQSCSFNVADARGYNLEREFDAAISLFHVASYHTSNDDFQKYLKTVYKHLKNEGVFIFDFWYGPAVLTDRPVVRVKRLENDNKTVSKIAEPVMFPNSNIVEINYEIITGDKKKLVNGKFNEKHRMRYFFMPELELFMKQSGFSIVDSYRWMTYSQLDFDSWYGVIIIRKTH